VVALKIVFRFNYILWSFDLFKCIVIRKLIPADMDRLPHLINTEKKFSVVNNQVRQLGLHLSRACLLYKGNRLFFY
jgi:hypothetical protein